MFNRFRKASKAGARIYLLLVILAPFVLVGLWALVASIVAVVQGDFRSLPDLLMYVVMAFGLAGFVVWLLRDAQKESKVVRPKGKARADGDMSDVAGIPQREPWLG